MYKALLTSTLVVPFSDFSHALFPLPLIYSGWHNWYVLPPSNTATLLIILNLLTILMSTLILHLSFFGRLLALYKRNFHRVECLTQVSVFSSYLL